MKNVMTLVVLLSLTAVSWAEANREAKVDRMCDAGDVLLEIMSAPDQGIPEEVLKHAKYIAVVPTCSRATLSLARRMAPVCALAEYLQESRLTELPFAATMISPKPSSTASQKFTAQVAKSNRSHTCRVATPKTIKIRWPPVA